MCVVTMHMVYVCIALVQVQACVRGRCAVCAWWVHVIYVSVGEWIVCLCGILCCVCSDVCKVWAHVCVSV